MKKVLLIAYNYFQKESIGSNRTRGLCKYLPEYGWEVTLITAIDSKSLRVIQSDQNKIIPCVSGARILNQLMSLFHHKPKCVDSINLDVKNKSFQNELFFNLLSSYWKSVKFVIWPYLLTYFFYPDGQGEWYKSCVNVGISELSHSKYDAILSTCDPFTSHCIARTLKNFSGLPWVADYRDLWAQRHYLKRTKKLIQKDNQYELDIIQSADVLTTVSQIFAEELSAFHHKQVYVIENGFDPESMNIGTPLNDKFTISYTGSLFWESAYNPLPLLIALSELINDGTISEDDVDVRFYGKNWSEWLNKDINRLGLNECVHQYGFLNKEKITEVQRSSQILLLLLWNSPGGEGVLTGKLYEYLAARRPILALGGEKSNDVPNILLKTRSGKYVSEVSDLKKQLISWYISYKRTGFVPYEGIDDEISAHDHRFMASKFASILHTLTEMETNKQK